MRLVIKAIWKRRFQVTLLLLTFSAIFYYTLHWGLKKQIDLSKRMEFSINLQWDGKPIDHDDIFISLAPTENGLKMVVEAPLFNDPPNPGTPRGEPLYGLWNYEVVEAFFLNDKKQYLEVELCPHGQHIVLMLSDYRKIFKQLLPMKYEAIIEDSNWKGEAIIPWDYFPPDINRFNAYAIHGTEPRRVYEALFPVPSGQFTEPDFHRLEFFGAVDFTELWPSTPYGYPAKLHSPFWNEPIPLEVDRVEAAN